MILVIVLVVFVVLGVAGGLAMRRSKSIQDNPNFAPTDHVEIARGFQSRLEGGGYASETHHDDDGDTFQMGD